MHETVRKQLQLKLKAQLVLCFFRFFFSQTYWKFQQQNQLQFVVSVSQAVAVAAAVVIDMRNMFFCCCHCKSFTSFRVSNAAVCYKCYERRVLVEKLGLLVESADIYRGYTV